MRVEKNMSNAHSNGMRSPITVHRSVALDANADAIWHAVNTPVAFRLVTRGLLRWRGAPPSRVKPWHQGETLRGLILVFGVIPVSQHTITIERIDPERLEFQSDERGGVIRSWRHLIRVTPINDGNCRYEDIVVIDAGVATPLIAAFANWFYGIRQRRWQELARLMPGAAPSGPNDISIPH